MGYLVCSLENGKMRKSIRWSTAIPLRAGCNGAERKRGTGRRSWPINRAGQVGANNIIMRATPRVGQLVTTRRTATPLLTTLVSVVGAPTAG